MSTKTACLNCDPCLSVSAINKSLISIADKRLYNTRYELNRFVDYDLFRLLVFYKDAAKAICEGTTNDCYDPVTDQDIIERTRILTA